ncbi:MAG: imelysin family protein [Rhodocyclaceae bacterium]
MHRTRIALLAAALVGTTPVSAAPSAADTATRIAAPILAPAQWLASLGEQRLAPGYAALAAQAGQLKARIDAYCQAPDAAGLAAARTAWRTAHTRLRALTPLPFGPALDTRILRRIDFWPTRPPQIEAAIAQYARSPGDTARIGLSARGLPALEYLLFGDAPLADAKRCAYARWMATDLDGALAPLPAAWRNWLASLPTDDDADEGPRLTDGVNILIGSVETLRLKYLDKALGEGRRAEFDAWRSANTRAGLTRYWQSLRAGLLGDGDTRGLSDVMLGRGLIRLTAALEARCAAVDQAIDTLPDPLDREAAVPAITSLIEALGRLQRLLAEDIADALRVSVGFGESDGD